MSGTSLTAATWRFVQHARSRRIKGILQNDVAEICRRENGIPTESRPVDSVDTEAPVVTVAFPGPLSLTHDDTVTVRGKAGDAGEITVVRVNGIDAVTEDGFENWEATVPLDTGKNTLTVETGDMALNTDRAILAIVGDFGEPPDKIMVMAVDLPSGDHSIISNTENGKGPQLGALLALALDSPNNRALVLGRPGMTLSLVDLIAGDRVIVSKSR